MLRFFDLSTLADRLQEDDTTSIEFLGKDGNWLLARFIVKKRNAQGRVTHVLYVTRLINDTKRREQNWIAIAEEANRANAAKTDFLSRMAHDIRTPMNAVRGFTQITREHLDDPQRVRDGLDKIEYAGRYLEQIVDDILDLTRIESGQMKLSPKTTNLPDTLREFDQVIRGIPDIQKLTFRCISHDLIHENILVDVLRLKQIYTNLVSNAVKYTPAGDQVELEVYQEALPESGWVRLVSIIRDTGIGMTPEYMQQMYSKFSRAVDTRVNKVRGSGLGLFIVKQLVDLMGGTIEARSTLGAGTTFRIVLDLPYTQAAAPDQISAGAPELCRGMHLLIAEDNDLNYEVISALLEPYGLTCNRAETGTDCVQKFIAAPEHTYDAILMDVMMPEMDGLEATTVIRSLDHPDAKTIPIFAMTANAFSTDVDKSLAAGMNGHFSKPVDIPKLLTALAPYRKRAQ